MSRPLGCHACDASWHGFDVQPGVGADEGQPAVQTQAELVISHCSYRLDWLLAELAQAGLAVGEKAATAAHAAAIDAAARSSPRPSPPQRFCSGEGSYRALPAKKS